MSLEVHKSEVTAALKVNRKLRVMQDGISPSKHPHNSLTRIYRDTRKLIFSNFNNLTELRYLLSIFSSNVTTIVAPLFKDAESLGKKASLASITRRKIKTTGINLLPSNTTPALSAVIEVANSQITQTLAVAAIGGAVETVIGDGINSVGFFSQGVLNKQINGYITALTAMATLQTYQLAIAEQILEDIFYKQAIAAIDGVTTECCLIVHGQFQKIESDFQLIGSPRFADRIFNPPFHWNCRTATALVHASERFDGLTQEMITAASNELKARGDNDYRVEIHPAFALSGR